MAGSCRPGPRLEHGRGLPAWPAAATLLLRARGRHDCLGTVGEDDVVGGVSDVIDHDREVSVAGLSHRIRRMEHGSWLFTAAIARPYAVIRRRPSRWAGLNRGEPGMARCGRRIAALSSGAGNESRR